MKEGEYQVVSRWVFDPTKSLFKQFANSKAESETIFCKLDKCPLRDAETCTWGPVLGYDKCPYGKVSKQFGPTKRAKSFRAWINEQKALYPGIGKLGSPANKLAFIGEYVYMPYAHMDMNKEIPFLVHSHVFQSGCAFVPSSAWTLTTVLSLLDFKPMAMMGGQITQYQKESVPRFLAHLREADKEMWQALIKERPTLDVPPDHVGRKALLSTLNNPIEWETGHKDYNVRWRWDGSVLCTKGLHAYNSTWGGIKLESLELRGVPVSTVHIKVQDNSWVNSETQFAD